MGGVIDHKQDHDSQTINLHFNNRQVIANNDLLWSVILDLSEENIDNMPFSARQVVMRVGKRHSGSLITRERGGLCKLLCDYRADFLLLLSRLVNAENNKTGAIDHVFCRRLGFLITDYSPLFVLDIITDSHRNTKAMPIALKSLINEKHYLFFGAEVYQLLMDWNTEEEGFTRELVLTKYEKQLHRIFERHQVTRPDMTVTTNAMSMRRLS